MYYSQNVLFVWGNFVLRNDLESYEIWIRNKYTSRKISLSTFSYIFNLHMPSKNFFLSQPLDFGPGFPCLPQVLFAGIMPTFQGLAFHFRVPEVRSPFHVLSEYIVLTVIFGSSHSMVMESGHSVSPACPGHFLKVRQGPCLILYADTWIFVELMHPL